MEGKGSGPAAALAATRAILTTRFDLDTLYACHCGVTSCVTRHRAPAGPASDATVYLVLNDFGPLGRAYVETDEAHANDATIVENILNGQYSQPLRVVAFSAAEGWARDVTEDIGRAALRRAQSERRPIGKVAQEFLERTLGVDVTVVTEMDLKHEIEKDIKRYSSILEKYKSGKLETGDLEGQDHLLDKTTDVSRHLENIIRELQALLRDG